MKKAIVNTIIVVIMTFTLLTMFTTASPVSTSTTYGPYLDDLYLVEIENMEAALAALQTGELQALTAIESPDALNDLIAAGYHVVNLKLLGQQFITFNCQMWPTNNTDFRRALAYLFPKESLIEQYIDPTGEIAHSLLPSGFGPYYNDGVRRYEFDPEQAKTILDNAGFTLDPGTGKRINPTTGQPLEPVQLLYRETVPMEYVGPRFATEMSNVGIPVDEIVCDRSTWITRVLSERSYNIELQGGQEGRVPSDYLYSLYHSDNDYEYGYNWAGVLEPDVQAQIDQAIETSLYTLNETAAIEACYLTQELLAEYVPRIPFFDIKYPTAYDPELIGIMEYPLFMDSHLNELKLQYKSGEGGIVRFGLPTHGDTLNPLMTLYATSRWMIGLVTEGCVGMGVVGTHPYSMEEMPWVAEDWEIEPWEAAPGVTGQKTTLWLKSGILWHDNVEFTAEDIEFALRYIQNKRIPYALNVWGGLVDINVVNPYQIEIYHNTTNLFMIRLMNEYMAALPKHVWNDDVALYGEPAGLPGIQDGYEYGVGDPTTFRPWEVSHPNVPGLTCLIGTGMFIFRDAVWNDYVHLEANRNYFRRILLSDINIDFEVNILDIATAAAAFGSTPGEARWNVIGDVNGDNTINILDIAAIALDFGEVW